MRRDQQLQPISRAGVGPAPTNIGVFARVVIIAGPAGGLFVYSPTVGKGHLIMSVAAANGTDPYGNKFYAGLATYAPSGGNSLVINLLSTANDAFFQYNMPSGGFQGGLILAVSSASGTDPFGNNYPAGLYGIDPVFGDTFVGVGSQIFLNQILFTRAAQVASFAGSGSTRPALAINAPEQGPALHLQIQLLGESPDSTHVPQMLAGSVAGGGSLGAITASLAEFQGAVALTNAAAPASAANSTQLYDAAGVARSVSGNDGLNYAIERLSLITSATTTINNTVPIAITGLQFTNVAAGATYRVHAMIRLTAAAAGVVQPFAVRVNGTATVTTMLLQFMQWNAESGGTQTLGVTTALNADPTHIIGTVANSSVATFYVDGSVTFTTAGTFGFTARAVTANADETATAQTGNFADLMPI